MHDARIGQRLAAACGRHVDDKGAMQFCLVSQGKGRIGCLVLPMETARAAALAKRGAAQMPQMFFKAGKRVANPPGVPCHAQEVFVQGLIQAAMLVSVGIRRTIRISFDPLRRLGIQAGVMVIGQHQRHAGQVHDEGVVQPFTLVILLVQTLQTHRQLRHTLAPL